MDGGTTPDGRPFLVMEYVEGLPIHRYCDRNRLNTRCRLELFLRILDAVAYAHQNLVVHCDLKSNNILVTKDGCPKLLDFGIAKILDADRVDTTPVAERLMTPRYASPEQVAGEPVTTASDVYALGVLLYQLLTGGLPCGLKTCPEPEVARRIQEDEPLRPSVAVHGDTTAGCFRDGDSRTLRRRLVGDVDAIVLKALAKEPRRRYTSVEQLAADVQRHLEGLPIIIRREAWLYRAGKLVRRHQLAALAAALILTFGLVATGHWLRADEQRQRADLERAEAVRERDRAERVADFLQNVIKAANPDVARGRDLTVHEILEEGRAQLAAGGLAVDPHLEAVLAGTLGDVYRNLGIYDTALELLGRSVEIRRELHPGGHPELAIALNDLASAHYYLGSYDDAARRFREALEMRLRLDQEPASLARAYSNLASARKQQGRYGEARKLYLAALEIRERIDGADALSVASSLYAQGALELELGDLAKAEASLRRALAIRIRELGDRHTGVATIRSTLGRTLHARGAIDEAETLHREALAVRQELLGDEHPHVALTRRDLAAVLLDRGDTAEAGALLAPALESLRRSQSPDDWTIASAESLWGSYLVALGRVDSARPFLERSYAALVVAKGEMSITTRQAQARFSDLGAAGKNDL